MTLWNRREQYHQGYLIDNINHFNEHSQRALNVLSNLGFKGLVAYQQLDNIITHQALMLATKDVFWLLGWCF